jgi:hypothetical protein
LCATVLIFRDGKAAERARESEDLPRLFVTAFEVRGYVVILRIKKGNPRIEIIGPGIFFLRKGEDQAMHLYWRIKEELLYLGEVLLFLDPRFVREYGRWAKRRLAKNECLAVRAGKGGGK